MEKKKLYNIVVGKNNTGKTQYISKIQKTTDISHYYLLEWESIQKSMYYDLMKKHNIEILPKKNNINEIKKTISKIKTISQEIKNKLILLKKTNIEADKDLKLYESIYSCRHHSLDQQNCLVCNNDFNSEILIAHQRELGLYLEQQHINFKNKVDYNNLKIQYQSLEKEYLFNVDLSNKAKEENDTCKKIYDDFISEIEKIMKDDLKIKKPQVKIVDNSIIIKPVISRTNRVYLSFIIANYLYENQILTFDDIGLDSNNLKNLIKFIHEKKYNNEIYISSLILPKGRILQSWNIIEL